MQRFATSMRRFSALIDRMDQKVEAGQAPFRNLISLVMTIRGADLLSARIILLEISPDMNRFPTAGNLLSWAGLCSRNDDSAGKRRSTWFRKGGRWLKSVLVQCAMPVARKKGSYFKAQFHRLVFRSRSKEGGVRGRGLDTHHGLPHAEERHTI